MHKLFGACRCNFCHFRLHVDIFLDMHLNRLDTFRIVSWKMEVLFWGHIHQNTH